MFLRELEGEVPENVAPGLLTARPLQRDFRILISLQLRVLLGARESCLEFESWLFRGSQCRAQITEFIVDLIGFLDGQTDFFPEQRAVTNPELMDEALH